MSFETILVDRFIALYGPPQTENPALYLAEWRRNFSVTDPEILTAAVNTIIRRHTFTTWPTIGEVVKAVDEVAGTILQSRRFKQASLPPHPSRQPTEDERGRVGVLVKGLTRKLEADALEHFGPPPKPLPDVSRDAFEKMQRESPNPGLHRQRVIRNPAGEA